MNTNMPSIGTVIVKVVFGILTGGCACCKKKIVVFSIQGTKVSKMSNEVVMMS